MSVCRKVGEAVEEVVDVDDVEEVEEVEEEVEEVEEEGITGERHSYRIWAEISLIITACTAICNVLHFQHRTVLDTLRNIAIACTPA
ncbi:hypothetical protein M0802_012185 [Mischocyttarus mexicanus]|nr:hypothetical protein M0802_012185 [Mischocyttarus mexicanus]